MLSTAQIRLIRQVADHYAGTFADVVRLAVPPRHATTEKAPQRTWPTPGTQTMPPGGLASYPDGAGFLSALAQRAPIRAYWQVAPRFAPDSHGLDDWTRGIVQATVATLRAGRGVIVLVPDIRDLVRVREALGTVIGLGASPNCTPTSGSRPATATTWRSAAARRRWWSAPGPPSTHRSPTWG